MNKVKMALTKVKGHEVKRIKENDRYYYVCSCGFKGSKRLSFCSARASIEIHLIENGAMEAGE